MQKVALVGVKQTSSCSFFGLVPLRILRCLGKFAHRRPRKLQFACNRSLTEPLFKQRAHLFIANQTLVPSDLLLKFVVPHSWWSLVWIRGNGSIAFLWFWPWFRLWLCWLVGALVCEALCLDRDAIRDTFFYFRQRGLLAIHQLFESFPQILQQVEPIGNLLSLGSAFPGSRCVLSPAIPTHDVHFW